MKLFEVTNDGSRDKVCVICGKRAMQGVICLSVK